MRRQRRPPKNTRTPLRLWSRHLPPSASPYRPTAAAGLNRSSCRRGQGFEGKIVIGRVRRSPVNPCRGAPANFPLLPFGMDATHSGGVAQAATPPANKQPAHNDPNRNRSKNCSLFSTPLPTKGPSAHTPYALPPAISGRAPSNRILGRTLVLDERRVPPHHRSAANEPLVTGNLSFICSSRSRGAQRFAILRGHGLHGPLAIGGLARSSLKGRGAEEP